MHNPDFAIDTNIGSLLRGLEGRDDPALIIEADVAFDGAAADALVDATRDGASVWFTRGGFQPHQLGGILRANAAGAIDDLRYVPAWEQRFAGYRKLLGILYAGRGEMPAFHQLLRTAAARSLAQYFMIPWCEHLGVLPAREGDLSRCRTATFNTEEDYRQCQEPLRHRPRAMPAQLDCSILLVAVSGRRHIEGFSRSRVEWLAEKIRREGRWTKPLALEREHHLVMDGQHRMEVARKLGLTCVPALLFDYDEVEVWSLRPGKYEVSGRQIVERALAGHLYPYKTAKHRFPVALPELSIPLGQLYQRRNVACA